MTAGWQTLADPGGSGQQADSTSTRQTHPQGSIITILKKYVYASKTAIGLFKSTLQIRPVKKKRGLKAVF